MYKCLRLVCLGVHIINIKKTWEKLLLAARAIAAIENPVDVCVISARPYGQRAVLKFASATGATPIAGRFTPGTFTNQIQVRPLNRCPLNEMHRAVYITSVSERRLASKTAAFLASVFTFGIAISLIM